MMRKLFFIFLMAIGPLVSKAQKAYETATYNAKMNGQALVLKLANGYIGASEIDAVTAVKKSPLIYRPESGVADDNYQLIFKSDKPSAGYFIIKNMREAYDQIPAVINGVFIKNNHSSQIKFRLAANKL